MSKQTSLPGREASWNRRTNTPHIPMKRPSSKPSPRKNGSSNTQTTTSQTASTNWTGQSRLFCSGWELDTTDLTPTCTTNSRLASLRCAHAMQTSWLQDIYCSIVHYMMLWGRIHGRNRRLWGTSSMATWKSWSPSSVRLRGRRRRHLQQVSTVYQIPFKWNKNFGGNWHRSVCFHTPLTLNQGQV